MRLMVLLLAVSARMGHALLSSTKSRFISRNHLRQLPIRYNNNIASSSLGSADEASPSSCTAADDDLTLEEYILRLSEVRGHYRTTGTLSQEQVCMNMLATRCLGLNLNRCYLGVSHVPGAGRGLFASRDIREGELITLYPGDALLYWENGRNTPECSGGKEFN
jgi:hypothetical protein